MDILDYLESEDIKINAVPGAHILPLYEACRKKHYKNLITWRTENGSGFGALGNIQSTGNPSIVISTAGPGITNIVTHVAQADAEYLPLIAIGVNNYFWDLDQRKGLIHEIPDTRPIFSKITYESIRIETSEQFIEYILSCVSKMKRGQSRPVYIEIPSNIVSDIFNHNLIGIQQEHNFKSSNNEYEERLLSDIKNSKNIAILVGWGAQLSNSGNLICKLAERIGAVIVTTNKGKGTVSDKFHLNCGSIWDRTRPFDEYAKKVDLVIALGTSLGSLSTRNGSLPIDKKMYHIITDGSMLKKTYFNSNILNCDINNFLNNLLLKLDDSIDTNRINTLSNWCNKVKLQLKFDLNNTVPEVYKLIDIIRNGYSQNTQFSFDICQEAYWLKRYLDVENPYTLHMPIKFATLGCSIPTAIGSAISSGKDVVCITGDGGFSYGFSEISTAIKYKIPIKIILFNNNCFGSLNHPHKNLYNTTCDDYDLVNPNYKEIAKSFGINYYFTNNDMLGKTISEANKEKSYIIEVNSKEIPMFNSIKWPEWIL